MKILFIIPENDIGCQNVRVISSYLKENNQESVILNLPLKGKTKTLEFVESGIGLYESEEQLNEITKFINKKNPDFVGLSLMSPFLNRGIEITKIVKDLEIPVMWGGVHPSSSPNESLRYADIICLWEGEEPLLELANNFDSGKDYHKIMNLWFNENGKIIKNKIRPQVKNLDKYPFPDYDLKTNYILYKDKVQRMTTKLLKIHLPSYSRNFDFRSDIKTKFFNGNSYRIITSRGCPFNCSYCCNSIINKVYKNKVVLRRSVDNIIDELKLIIEKFDFINHIRISDDNFILAKKDWIKYFCKRYKEEIDLPFGFLTHPIFIEESIIENLYDAGLAQINIGIQSGSEKTCKKVYNRLQHNNDIIRTAKILNKFKKIIPLYDIIVDCPWENNNDLKKTLNLILKLPKPYVLTLYSLIFFPGTLISKKAIYEKIIDENYDRFQNEEYTNYNLNNYYNLLIATAPYLPKWLIRKFEENPNILNKKILIFMVEYKNNILNKVVQIFHFLKD
jgi:radical SAM superfamily enzyme YgiQ (UPF0313 family)